VRQIRILIVNSVDERGEAGMQKQKHIFKNSLILFCLLIFGVVTHASLSISGMNEFTVTKEEYHIFSTSGDSAVQEVKGNGESYALLIGNSNYPNLGDSLQLIGPDNDLILMKNALIARGFDKDHVHVVHNGTRQQILDAMKKLGVHAGKGDVVYLYFTGHSTRYPDEKGELKYAYLPSDIGEWDNDPGVAQHMLAGEKIFKQVLRLRNQGAFVVLVLDTAHSGAMSLIMDGSEQAWRLEFDNKVSRKATVIHQGRGGFAAFYACARDETTPEMSLDEGSENRKPYGVFSYYLAEIMNQGGELSYHQVAKKLILVYQKRYLASTIHPVFEMSDPDAVFLGKPARTRGGGESGISIVMKPMPVISGNYRGAEAMLSGRSIVEIQGRVKRAAGLIRVSVNSIAATYDEYGVFKAKIPVFPGENSVDVVATYRDNSIVPAHFKVPYVPEGGIAKGENYALLIGINSYADSSWPHLTTPVGDMHALRDLLTGSYNFKTEIKQADGSALNLIMENSTGRQILEMLYSLVNTLKSEDQLLIFYAGHGYILGKRGFWVPSDVKGTRTFDMVSSTDITDQLILMAAKHVLIISDSCYSGALAERGRKEQPVIDKKIRGKWLAQMLRSKSRRLLSSGANEPVLDGGGDGHSVFARALLRELGDPLYDRFTMQDLVANIEQSTAGAAGSNQEPQFQAIRASGHDKGALIFSRVQH